MLHNFDSCVLGSKNNQQQNTVQGVRQWSVISYQLSVISYQLSVISYFFVAAISTHPPVKCWQ